MSIEVREQTNYRFLLLPHGISGIQFLEKSPMQLYVLNFRGKRNLLLFNIHTKEVSFNAILVDKFTCKGHQLLGDRLYFGQA